MVKNWEKKESQINNLICLTWITLKCDWNNKLFWKNNLLNYKRKISKIIDTISNMGNYYLILNLNHIISTVF